MPPKDRVGSDKRSNFGEGATSDRLTSNRKSTTLIVGQSESSTPELLPQDAVLFFEVFDDCVLFTTDPAGQSCNEDLPRLKDGGHRLILLTPQANRQLSAGWQTG